MKEKCYYEITANPRCTGEENAFIVQEYERVRPGEAIPGQVLFIGTLDECKKFTA